ncbi:MAG: division/cell wall cluster transcriptional repressor MraZ [Gammaproteobacteria bacterium]|nr:division/cell wall cluster transcriptional repressor MraZ [Gammaproteobacteria bacterium]MBL6999448.1 division/cell wall cluster transcriptional repressor MraZ [Gammaproteobacteria bacterium]
MKFRGASNLSLDAKGRVVLPARYRELLSEICNGQLVVTIDIDQPCLLIYPLNEWEIVEQKINALPGGVNKAVRRIQRKLIGYATDIEVNESGRLLLTAPLRNYARLDKKVVLIGQGNKFELWDEQLWDKLCMEEDDDEDIPAALAELSL